MDESVNTNMLILTCLDDKSGYLTDRASKFGGMASMRLQTLPMIRAARRLDLNPKILSLDIDKPSLISTIGQPNLCVISKINHFDNNRMDGFAMATLAAVARLKSRRVPVAIMYCDHLSPLKDSRGALYRDLLHLADHCLVPCLALAQRASQYVDDMTPVTVIEDPWQVRLQPYLDLIPGAPLRLAWFGNNQNIYFFCAQLVDLMRTVTAVPAVHLIVLATPIALEEMKAAFQEALPFAVRSWTLEVHPWDDKSHPNQLEDVLGSSHMVWLPSDPDNYLKAGVSHNRLVDSVRSGCVPVASAMQSYAELRRVAVLGPNHGDLINLVIAQYDRLIAKHDAYRCDLLARFSPSLNDVKWENALREILEFTAAS